MNDLFGYLENACKLSLKVNILDIIFFEDNTMKWIFTNKNSYLELCILNNITLESIINFFLKNIPISDSNKVISFLTLGVNLYFLWEVWMAICK